MGEELTTNQIEELAERQLLNEWNQQIDSNKNGRKS